MTDGHYSSYRELLEKTQWDKYGVVDGVAPGQALRELHGALRLRTQRPSGRWATRGHLAQYCFQLRPKPAPRPEARLSARSMGCSFGNSHTEPKPSSRRSSLPRHEMSHEFPQAWRARDLEISIAIESCRLKVVPFKSRTFGLREPVSVENAFAAPNKTSFAFKGRRTLGGRAPGRRDPLLRLHHLHALVRRDRRSRFNQMRFPHSSPPIG
jgi:hypothetical protein